MRRGTYAKRPVYCPNASTFGYSKRKACPGDVLTWKYKADDVYSGRMLARVNAHADGPDVPAVRGFIAVLELTATFDHAFVRWIDPKDVTEVRRAPVAFPAWFFGELPPIDKILAAEAYGSLDEHYVEQAKAEGRL